ncbi:MAG: ShlB/FhaC/HecB family hemolysin secretion/activation protein [Candidatus Limnocylindrus sp.]
MSAILFVCCFSFLAARAAPTDAGSILRQIERSLPAPQLPQVGPSPVEADVIMPVGKGEKITVKGFVFFGNTVIADAELEAVLRPYLGRPLSFEELKNAAAQVTLLYRDRGYLAAAGIPKQDVTDGVVMIEVREGWFGSVRFEGAADGRLRPGVLEAYVQAACERGAPLNLYDLDRALLLINDLSGASVQGAITKGQAKGQSDVLLVVAPSQAASGTLMLDNSGARSTGSARILGGFSWNSPLGKGDQHGLDFLKTEGSDYWRLSTQLPVGHEGFKLSARVSRLDYDLVADEFVSAQIHGSSTTFSLEGYLPLLRSRSFNLFASLGGDFKAFRNFGNGAATSDYHSRLVTLGLKGNRFDQWFGGGTTAFGLDLVRGSLDLDGSPNLTADSSGPRAAGEFTKAIAQCSRTQTLFGSTSLVASAEGQLAMDRNLDSSEKFFVGGAGSVRAYPASEGGGDSGYLGSIEVRHQFAEAFTASVFVDHGRVFVNKNPGFSGASPLNDLSYDGFGFGLAWAGPRSSRFSLSWARRIGANPNPRSGTGADQDGSSVLNRFWGSASFHF